MADDSAGNDNVRILQLRTLLNGAPDSTTQDGLLLMQAFARIASPEDRRMIIDLTTRLAKGR
jgi:hypothetical protein